MEEFKYVLVLLYKIINELLFFASSNDNTWVFFLSLPSVVPFTSNLIHYDRPSLNSAPTTFSFTELVLIQ